ncbi:hypothetical protein, partial [Acidithiobacillus caldus]
VSGKRALTPKSQKIKNPTCKHKDGMATYNAFASTVALTIDDQPWSYTPPKGPAVAFRLAYNQRDTQQPANFSFSNVGHQWGHGWMNWIQDIPGEPGNSVIGYEPSGAVLYYSGYDASTGAFAPQSSDGSILTMVSQDPVRYVLQRPDGSQE